MRQAFWNADEGRLRSVWRLLLFLLLVGVVANPLILLLDTTNVRILENSLENALVAVGFFTALAVSVRYFEKRPFADYGLSPSRVWFREFGMGLLLGGAAVAVICLPLLAAGRFTVSGLYHNSFAGIPFVAAIAGQLIRYLSGSFFEELFSRSYLLRFLAENLRGFGLSRARAVFLGLLGTSLLFGVLHVFNPDATALTILNLVLLGGIFGIPVVLSGRLGYSVGLHMGWNVAQNNILGLPNGGRESLASFFALEPKGSGFWTGGELGPEGGMVTTLVLLAGNAVLIWIVQRRCARGEALFLMFADAPPLNHANEEPS